jgi:beta-lactamase class A
VKRFAAVLLACVVTGGLGGCVLRDAPPPRTESVLQTRLNQLAAETDGTVGVSVLHLRTGARTSVHGDARLPMMSVFKLPLAVATLAAIDAGQFKMETPIPITAAEIVPDVSPVADAWAKGEKSPTLETLLRLMIQQSDNTAGDKLVSLNGGGAKVTQQLRKMGVLGVDVAEQEINIFARIRCAGTHPPAGGWTSTRIGQCKEASKPAQLAAAQQEVARSPNGATANAMVDLLAALAKGTILSDASRKWLLSTLAGTATGAKRLKGLLPDATPVAHKTGTGDTVSGLNIATNDVGIVTLPSGDQFAIAVFIAGSHGDPTSL